MLSVLSLMMVGFIHLTQCTQTTDLNSVMILEAVSDKIGHWKWRRSKIRYQSIKDIAFFWHCICVRDNITKIDFRPKAEKL